MLTDHTRGYLMCGWDAITSLGRTRGVNRPSSARTIVHSTTIWAQFCENIISALASMTAGASSRIWLMRQLKLLRIFTMELPRQI